MRVHVCVCLNPCRKQIWYHESGRQPMMKEEGDKLRVTKRRKTTISHFPSYAESRSGYTHTQESGRETSHMEKV